jgi:hypothetical protein
MIQHDRGDPHGPECLYVRTESLSTGSGASGPVPSGRRECHATLPTKRLVSRAGAADARAVGESAVRQSRPTCVMRVDTYLSSGSKPGRA